MSTIALVNHKGGVGKTTTAVNLAAALALKEKRVLLVDLDSQASATIHLGFDPDWLETTMADVLARNGETADAILNTATPGLALLPSDESLAQVNVALAGEVGRESRLRRKLKGLDSRYDFLLIDCPPSLSVLTINAIVASEYAFIPVTPDFLSLKGLAQLQEILEKVHEGLEIDVKILGIVPTIVDYRKSATRESLELLRGTFSGLVTETEIRINVRLEEAPSHGKTIFEYDPRSVGAKCYRRLAEEVLKRCDAG